jgi:hypothetical protein
MNFEKAFLLLQVAEKAFGYPAYKWLVDLAHEELQAMEPKKAEAPKPAIPPEAQKFREEMAKLETPAPRPERKI